MEIETTLLYIRENKRIMFGSQSAINRYIHIDLTTNIAMCSIVSNVIEVNFLL